MPNMKTNDYTVCIVFDPTLDNVLLVRKNRTAFKDMLNGPGGAIEPGEAPYDGALREIYEETGLSQEDFQSLGCARLAKLGELLVPADCKTNDGSACRLHYYAGAVKPTALGHVRPSEEALSWETYGEVAGSGTESDKFAGNGDLAYFAAAGRRTLLEYLPGSAREEPASSGIQGLMDSMNAARGRLDADFRHRDLFRASLDAADVARLAHTIFYAKMLAQQYDAWERSSEHAGSEAERKTGTIPTDGIV